MTDNDLIKLIFNRIEHDEVFRFRLLKACLEFQKKLNEDNNNGY